MNAPVEVPDWIRATQRRPRFVPLTAQTLERALAHYGGRISEAKPAPECPKPVETPKGASKTALPEYLVRQGRDRRTLGKGAPSAPPQSNQPHLF